MKVTGVEGVIVAVASEDIVIRAVTFGVTVTVAWADWLQPVAVYCPVTEYVVVLAGLATTVLPVTVFNPVAGDQV